MADDHSKSRRSFLAAVLTRTAGGWVALTSVPVVASFLAACRRKSPGASKPSEPMEPQLTKYGGPRELPPEPMERVVPPADPMAGGANPVTPDPMPPEPARPRPYPRPVAKKYGVKRPPKDQVRKYGIPKKPKYGVMRPLRPLRKKYGRPQRTKYGVPGGLFD
ncbi:MAG: hypothetical protein ABI333_16480 [bacterium]